MGKCDDESPECKKDIKDYSDAAFERATAEQAINQANDLISRAEKGVAAGGATAAGGLGLAGGAGWTGAGLVVGLGIAALGVGITIGGLIGVASAQSKRDQGRKDCEAARQRMKAAYDKSLVDCKDGDCRPSPVAAPCP